MSKSSILPEPVRKKGFIFQSKNVLQFLPPNKYHLNTHEDLVQRFSASNHYEIT